MLTIIPTSEVEWSLYEVRKWIEAVEQRGLKVSSLDYFMQPQVQAAIKLRDTERLNSAT